MLYLIQKLADLRIQQKKYVQPTRYIKVIKFIQDVPRLQQEMMEVGVGVVANEMVNADQEAQHKNAVSNIERGRMKVLN